ncbi:hypothetical protein E5288_WYG019212 [Bos mutus]|uniref:Uncharacterized protein n=1 Tax=Bos mutus TaxID=72004 RepID=A0A6B0SG87_9CETA|nr:hypothetical protein [Bos mutus]
MAIQAPSQFLELASQSLLQNKSLAFAALEELPIEPFLWLFTAAFAGRHTQALKAMEVAGAGLAPELPPGLLVWHRGQCLLADGAQPSPAYAREAQMDAQVGLKPVQVLVDLCLKEDTLDEILSYLLKKAKQRRRLLQLHSQKLRIFTMAMQSIRRILKMVQLDSVQDPEVNCTWKLSTLGRFMPHLGQMGNLRLLLVSCIHELPHTAPDQEEHCIGQHTTQFLNLSHLQELYLDSIFFLEGLLHQALLETLWITNCLTSESDLMYLSQCPSVSLLKDLCLSRVDLTSLILEPLQVLIKWTSTTLQELELDECGFMDKFSTLLPSLNHCFQLTTFRFYSNFISMAVLESLLHHTMVLSKLSHVLYPALLESYEGVRGTLSLGLLAQLHTQLKPLLCKSRWPSMVWVSASPRPHCGDQIFYDTMLILSPCYTTT